MPKPVATVRQQLINKGMVWASDMERRPSLLPLFNEIHEAADAQG
jgi:hypothetical protein